MEPKNNKKTESVLHQIFEAGILIKAINGIWQTFAGFFILFLSRELSESPHDVSLNLFFKFLEKMSHNTQIFIILYTLIHGLINLFLVIQLYRNKIWAYIASIAVMTAFIFYQIYRITTHHSPILALITTFDIIFVILTRHEYKKRSAI